MMAGEQGKSKELSNGLSPAAGWDGIYDNSEPHPGGTKEQFGFGQRFAVGYVASTLSDRFDRLIPPRRTCFGVSRRVFLICVFAAALALLGLITGLAVGLTTKPKHVSWCSFGGPAC